MRTYTKDYTVYNYNELSEEAKEKVKQWLLNDDIRSKFFYEDIIEDFRCEFPRSELKVCFSLGYCQGDGLNVYGKLNFYDMLDKLDYTDKEKRTLEFYFDNGDHWYTFSKNNHYCYSCKFIDRKYIYDTIDEFINNLDGYRNINTELITRFYNDFINYFDEYDHEQEKAGYKYLYEISEEEAAEECNANEYEFFIDGKIAY